MTSIRTRGLLRKVLGDLQRGRSWVVASLVSLLTFLAAAALVAQLSRSVSETGVDLPSREQQEKGALENSDNDEPIGPQAEPPPQVNCSQTTPPTRICKSLALKVTLKKSDLAEPEQDAFSEKVTLQVVGVKGTCAAAPEVSVRARIEGGNLIVSVSVPSPTPCHGLEVTRVTISKNSIEAELQLREPDGFCVQCVAFLEAEIKLGPVPPGTYSVCIAPQSC